ncbi:MAG: hypothetical protein AABW72_00445 [archaeon]
MAARVRRLYKSRARNKTDLERFRDFIRKKRLKPKLLGTNSKQRKIGLLGRVERAVNIKLHRQKQDRQALLRRMHKEALREEKTEQRRRSLVRSLSDRSQFAEWFNWFSLKESERKSAQLTFNQKNALVSKEGNVIYDGRLHFIDPKTNKRIVKRVAIKTFKNQLDDAKAARYQQIISELVMAGVAIPKMGMMRAINPVTGKEEWVQVSQMFGSVKNSKVRYAESLKEILNTGKTPEIVDFAKTYASLLNKGYAVPAGMIRHLSTALGMETIPFDIDMLYEQRFEHPLAKPLADVVAETIHPFRNAPAINKVKYDFFVEMLLKRIKDPFLQLELRKKIVILIELYP